VTADAGAPPLDPDIRRWGLGDAVVGYFIAVFSATVFASAAVAVAGENSLLALTAGLVGLWLGLAGTTVYAARSKGSGSVTRDFGLRFAGLGDVVGGAAAGLASQYLLVGLIYAPILRLWPSVRDQIEKPAKDVTDRAHGPFAVTLLVLLVVIGAPLVEELFFRGLLLRSVSHRFGPAWAIAASSVAFGLVHFELIQLPALIAFGVVLGVLAVRTGRLGPGIAAHMAFNAVTVASLVAAH
jgi:membrane protease YdiL (CAAX protease family)